MKSHRLTALARGKSDTNYTWIGPWTKRRRNTLHDTLS